MKNFVRGKGNYAPFAPGGFEPEVEKADVDGDGKEVEEEEEEGWKTRAPGMRRGIKLDGGQLAHHVWITF